MKKLVGEASFELFDKYWDSLRAEWFKVEVLQDYSGEDDGPSLQAWLAGDKARSIHLMQDEVSLEWVKDCQKVLARGVKLNRVHIIERPLSEYMLWELEHYKNINIPQCGEQVFLVEKNDIRGLSLPAGDLMLFDNKRAVINAYSSDGRVVSSDFYDEADNIQSFLRPRTQLLKVATPIE